MFDILRQKHRASVVAEFCWEVILILKEKLTYTYAIIL